MLRDSIISLITDPTIIKMSLTHITMYQPFRKRSFSFVVISQPNLSLKKRFALYLRNCARTIARRHNMSDIRQRIMTK